MEHEDIMWIEFAKTDLGVCRVLRGRKVDEK